jgi:hypothetical protein
MSGSSAISSYVGYNNKLSFGTFSSIGGAITEKVTIDSSGNVGIGTTAPGELLSLGLAGTTKGVLSLSGNTSGKIIIQPAAAAGTYTLTLPTDDGTASQVLTTDGSGVLSWTTPSGGAGLTWSEVTGTSQAAAVDNGYICNNAELVTVTIPTTAAVGKIVRVSGKGAGGWKIAQNASEIIHFNGTDTTTGTGGYLASTATRDAVELVCVVADTEWNVISSVGNITIA